MKYLGMKGNIGRNADKLSGKIEFLSGKCQGILTLLERGNPEGQHGSPMHWNGENF